MEKYLSLHETGANFFKMTPCKLEIINLIPSVKGRK